MTMTKTSYNYNLPQNLIAQTPATKRDHSRLMIVDNHEKTIDAKHHFFDLPKFLRFNSINKKIP